jgi:porphobilinogen synthase
VSKLETDPLTGADRLDLPDRPRRIRRLESLRRLVAETRLSVDSLVYPMFIEPGSDLERPIDSMPGQSLLSPDRAATLAAEAAALGIPAVILFGRPRFKDDVGADAHAPDGAVQEAIRRIKDSTPDLTVITDVCLCAYTTHGHCGVLDGDQIDNDRSVSALARVALSHAAAGADLVAPSDMMDGRVGAIRQALDDAGHLDTAIMAYSAKYASAFYGPFREAADSTPAFGDRRSYQMDPPNAREALHEIELDRKSVV